MIYVDADRNESGRYTVRFTIPKANSPRFLRPPLFAVENTAKVLKMDGLTRDELIMLKYYLEKIIRGG